MKLLREIIQEYECIFVRGNKEDYWLERKDGRISGWKEKDSTTGMLYYAYEHLTEADLAFFESMPYVQTIHFEKLPSIVAYHGSHNHKGEKLTTSTILDQNNSTYAAKWNDFSRNSTESGESVVP